MDRTELAVQQWARERPDLPSLPIAIFGRISEASERVLRDHLNPIFALSELHPGEFDVLAALRRSGEPYTLSPTALYETLAVSSGGMTNRLDRLERAGLIERQPDPDDRRAKLIRLTEFAKREVDEIIGRQAVDVERLLSVLSPQERETLNALLAKLIAGL